MFRNVKTRSGSEILRMEKDEELTEAVERLRLAGWDIPDIPKLELGSDSTGKFFKIKGSKPEDGKEEV
jgi:hypothetical protein